MVVMTLKKVIKNKNRYLKSANNHKILSHKIVWKNHIVSKDWGSLWQSLSPIYQMLNNDFDKIDLVDLEFYERWLNG